MGDPEKKCPLFRKPESLSIGKRIGYCDIDSSSTTCEGDVKFCERPDALRQHLLKKLEESPVILSPAHSPRQKAPPSKFLRLKFL